MPASALEHYSWPLMKSDRHRQEMRRRLERSQLAQKLAGGADMLALIDDFLPRWWRPLQDRIHTRSPGALAVHVMKHLDWYLQPPRPVRLIDLATHWRIHRKSYLAMLAALLVVTLGALLDIQAFFVIGAILLLLGFLSWGMQHLCHILDHDTLCSEYFRYLVDTYSDAPEDGR